MKFQSLVKIYLFVLAIAKKPALRLPKFYLRLEFKSNKIFGNRLTGGYSSSSWKI